MKVRNLTLDELSQMVRSAMTEKEAEDSMHGLQISPTENYLQHEYRGWCFVESAPMCCGYFPRYMEDYLREMTELKCCSSKAKLRTKLEESYIGGTITNVGGSIKKAMDVGMDASLGESLLSGFGYGESGATELTTLTPSLTKTRSTRSDPTGLISHRKPSAPDGPRPLDRQISAGTMRARKPSSDWEEQIDEVGRTYFWNHKKNQASWTTPASME